MISSELQEKWFQQMIEAVIAIHHFHIIHSDLPDVSSIFRGVIIQACWNGSISSAEEALLLYVHGSEILD